MEFMKVAKNFLPNRNLDNAALRQEVEVSKTSPVSSPLMVSSSYTTTAPYQEVVGSSYQMASMATVVVPPVDLSVNSPRAKREDKMVEPLNLCLVDRRLVEEQEEAGSIVGTPPRTPNTPSATSYKKHILKRYSK